MIKAGYQCFLRNLEEEVKIKVIEIIKVLDEKIYDMREINSL